MAYKFQLGTARLSGSLVQEGQIKAEGSALSGSSLSIGGVAVTSTATELNNLDGFADAAYDQTADSVVFFDATDNKLKREAANDFVDAINGAGLDASSGTLVVSAAQTGITSILNAGFLAIGTAADQEAIDFTQANEVSINVNGNSQLTVKSDGVDIAGDLTVQGSLTTIESANLVVNDHLIQLNAVTGSEGRTSNSGAGIFITGSLANGNNDVSLTCNADGGELKSSSGFDVAAGKTYQIDGSDVLSATALASTVIVDGDSLNISACNNTIASGDMVDADLMLVNDGAGAAAPKKATLGNLKTFFQTGVTADSAGKIVRSIDSSTGDDMEIGQDGGVSYFAITASATAIIDPGFSAGQELNIKAGPLVSESIVLTVSGAGGAGYTFDGFPSIQLESPNASIKLILRNASDWMIF